MECPTYTLNPLRRGTCTAPRIPVHLTVDLKIWLKKSNTIPPQIVRSQTLPNRSSALAGAAVTTLALSLTFTASDAAVAFWFFSATGKELGPPRLWASEILRWLVGNTNHREIWLFAFGNEILKLFPWWKSIQKIKKERSFHPRGQNSWPAVLSSLRSGIVVHLGLIIISEDLTEW